MHTMNRVGLALLAGLFALGALGDAAVAQAPAPGMGAPKPAAPQARPMAAPSTKDRLAARAPAAKANAGDRALAGVRQVKTQPKTDYLGLFVFFLLAFGCAGFGVVMITRKSPMMSALSLLVVFLCLAGIYVVLKAPFMAAIQLIVYAGAVIVLFVFVIMSMGLSATYSPRDLAKELMYFMFGFVATGCAALLFFYFDTVPHKLVAAGVVVAVGAFFIVYLDFPFTRLLGLIAASFAAVQLMRLATLTSVALEVQTSAKGKVMEVPLAAPLADDFGSAQSIGRSVFLDNAFAFEALSLLLLAAIVAAVVIVRSRKEAAQ